jgi:hypothetical protein
VLPGQLGEAASAWLTAEAACHEAVPGVSESTGHLLSTVAEEISGEEDVEVDFCVTISTLDKAEGFAREVLALADMSVRPADKSSRDAAARLIQEQLDGDWTTNSSVADREFFGDRTAEALASAGLLGPGCEPTSPVPEGNAIATVVAALRDAGVVDPDDDTIPVFTDRVGYWEGRIDHWETPEAVARLVVTALQQPGGLNPAIQDVRLTPEELAAVEARFKAKKTDAVSWLRPSVTRAQVRDAAHALFMWNNEVAGEPRFVLHHVTEGVDREPYGALVDEVLYRLGIRVQEGTGS